MPARFKKRVLFRKTPAFWLWTYLFLAAIYLVLTIYILVRELVREWGSVTWFSIILLSAIIIISLATFVSIWRLLNREIAFLDEYISFKSWYWTPRVYRYEDVIDIQTIIVSPRGETRWEFEDNVTLLMADGTKLRVPASMMQPQKVHKLIESKTGLKFGSTLKL